MVHEATAPKNRPYRDERAASDELFTLAERGPRCRSQTATASATSTSFPQVTAMVTVAQWMEPSAVTSLTASRRGKSVSSAAPPANKVAAITAADVPHRRPIQLLWLKVRRAASLHKSPAYWPALVQPVRLLRPLASAASRELIGPKLRSPSLEVRTAVTSNTKCKSQLIHDQSNSLITSVQTYRTGLANL